MNFSRKAKSALSSLLSRYRNPLPNSPSPRSNGFRHSPPPPYPSAPFSRIFRPAAPTGAGAGAGRWRRCYYYYVDNRPLQHFRRRGGPRWYQNPRAVLLVAIVGGGAAITVYYGNLETVPYTKRTHFILLSPSLERQLGESQFEQLKAALRGKILPALHPDSVRVRLIAKEIIDALQRGLRHDERRWSDMEYASEFPAAAVFATPERSRDTLLALSRDEEKIEEKWSRKDEILDDKWIHQSRKEGEARRTAVKHLEGLNWEILVVRDSTVNAFCLPGGKIVVFTGLLDHFRTDAEIATVIGHEVGHCVARHVAEMISKNLWFTLLQLILLQFLAMPDLISAMSNLVLRLPHSRRMEMEADYIGLLLLAAAGYDPRVAPKVYEKLGQIGGDSALRDYLSTHPSGKKRAQLLSQAQVMEEALAIYRESTGGYGVGGFL
uniref:LOW QUALITY PROTEIN: uncharacterized protein LOC105042099 n=1 Tax=Elaeis guineensis var. tenera TaxID=51953 RepID=A0A6I9QYM8_ELAGV|nr:LOW QUALITY PROTEIN: uncharacterized protein LOC105042099 [Elaeis guineensis]